jgi:hypothetical protein
MIEPARYPKIVRIIIILTCLALAVLAGLLLGSKDGLAGGGIIDPPGFPWKLHTFMPVIRHEGCPRGCLDPYEGSPRGCWIKGVVTGMGDWLYYTPTMGCWCEATLLVKYSGRWFCTEAEAVANGFVKAERGDWAWPELFWCQRLREACRISPALCWRPFGDEAGGR